MLPHASTATLVVMLVPLPRHPLRPMREAEPRPIRGAAMPAAFLVAVFEPDALLRPVLADALRAAFNATVVEVESLEHLTRLAGTFRPDLLVLDPTWAGSLDRIARDTPVLFTDVPPTGAPAATDRYAVLSRPFQLDDFLNAAIRLRVMVTSS